MPKCKNCNKDFEKLVGHGYCRNCYNKLRSKGKLIVNAQKCKECEKIKDIYAKRMCRKCYDRLRLKNKIFSEEDKKKIKEYRKKYQQTPEVKEKIKEKRDEKRQKELKKFLNSIQIKKIVELKKDISKQKLDKSTEEILTSLKEKKIDSSLRKKILKKRTEIIRKELSSYEIKRRIPPVLYNDYYVANKKIDGLFEDFKWGLETGQRDLGGGSYAMVWGVYTPSKYQKERNNEKIIKKYWGKKEDKKLFQIISLLGLNIDLGRSSRQIAIRILGKEKYNKMKKEFSHAWKDGIEVNGVGNAFSYFLSRKVHKIRKKLKEDYSKPKNCYFCGKKFYPAMIETELLKYYPIRNSVEEVDFCSSCLTSAFWGLYKGYKTKREMLIDLKDLVKSLGYIPNQRYFRNSNFTKNIPIEKFHEVMLVLIRIAPFSRLDRAFNFPPEYPKEYQITYKQKFGSWFKSLLLAGVLEGYVRETKRGTFCLADDGHLCLSMKEKTIDDWLYRNNLKHSKEPHYPIDKVFNPKGYLRADWKVGDVYVEYFGLMGSADYDIKTQTKRKLCKEKGIKLIEIFNKDLTNLDKRLKILKNKFEVK